MIRPLVAFSAALLLNIGAVSGAVVSPISYDMLNGEAGSFKYWDRQYSGAGNPRESLSPLSGGLGDLTDRVLASGNWFQVENSQGTGPYVGWATIDPTIRFSFGDNHSFRQLTIHFDDSNNNGGVNPPARIDVRDGESSMSYEVTDPDAGSPVSMQFDLTGLYGSTVDVTVTRRQAQAGPLNPVGDSYVMLSEVEFLAYDPIWGDTNNDWAVDLNDLANVRNHFGEGTAPGPRIPGDAFPFDGAVNLVDLALVRNNFGVGISVSTPEPASALLLAATALGLAVPGSSLRRRRVA